MFKHSVTCKRFKPITIASPEAARGSPCPTCPYAFPAKEAAMPRIANVVANPNEKATELATI